MTLPEILGKILLATLIILFILFIGYVWYNIMKYLLNRNEENYDTYVIDLPNVNYYDFKCNNPNVRYKTKDYLKDLTKQEILDKGGEQSDVDAMDFKLDSVTKNYSTQCNVIYSFKTPEHGEWKTNTSPRVTKIKTIKYRTSRSTYNNYGSYGYGGYPYSYGYGGYPYRGYGGYGYPHHGYRRGGRTSWRRRSRRW